MTAIVFDGGGFFVFNAFMPDDKNMKTEIESNNSQPGISKIGLDNLLEDIFGLNIRALKTIGVLFKSPFNYFEAARTPEWENKYTPSFRVWFGLVAMLVALNFIYNNDRSAMTSGYTDVIEQMIPEITKGVQAAKAKAGEPPVQISLDAGKAAKDMGKWVMVYYPFAYIPFMALIGIFVRFWGRQVTYVTRLRYLFGVVVPSVAFMLLSTFFFIFISTESLMWISALSIICVMALDFITAYRGPFKAMDAGKRLWRTSALTLILFLVYVLGTIFATVPAMLKSIGDNLIVTPVEAQIPSNSSSNA